MDEPLYVYNLNQYKPVASEDCMLADRWDKFIFVRYPQRRNLLATIESAEFSRGRFTVMQASNGSLSSWVATAETVPTE